MVRVMGELVSWDQRFFDPIVLSGRKLRVTLRDAAQYITKLPKAEHDEGMAGRDGGAVARRRT
jgi:hypothetical protein